MIKKNHIPYVDIVAQHLKIKDELLAAVSNVLDSGHFILGKEVDEFEQLFAELCGVKYAIGVNSGTDALILALKVLDVGPGDEVITVPNSFVATASCIALSGAKPVFIDVREDYNMNPSLITQAVTAKTKAIIPVHLTGRPADMDAILEVAHKFQLFVIEDSAQAVMAEYKKKRVGSFGEIGCFSLHPLKTLNACGDAGVLTTNNPQFADRLRILRNIGLKTRDNCEVWCGNTRLDTLQAAILLVKLKYLGPWTEKRRRNAQYYFKHLSPISQIRLPKDKPYEKAVYHTFIIQAENRNKLREHLTKLGIGTSIHYPIPIHLQKAAEHLGYIIGSFPNAEFQAQHILSLPIYPELKENDLEYVVNGIRSFYMEN